MSLVDAELLRPSEHRDFGRRLSRPGVNEQILAGAADLPGDGRADRARRHVFYEFQVSTSAAFGSLVASATVQEQTNTTSWTPSVDLPEATLFWRVRASDPANGISGPFSDARSFQRKFGIDLTSVTYVGPYPNIANWQETARITSASHGNGILCIEHTRLNIWPGLPFIYDSNTIVEGNQWMFANVGGKWYGGAGHWYRPGQACKGEVDERFFVDAFRVKPPFNSLVLRRGDVFGVAVTTPSRVWPVLGRLQRAQQRRAARLELAFQRPSSRPRSRRERGRFVFSRPLQH